MIECPETHSNATLLGATKRQLLETVHSIWVACSKLGEDPILNLRGHPGRSGLHGLPNPKIQ